MSRTVSRHCFGSARIKLTEDPDNQMAQKIISDAELSKGHPNSTDITNACKFIEEHLEKYK